MKRITLNFIILISCVLIISCFSSSDDLSWLDDKIAHYEADDNPEYIMSIWQFDYNGDHVYHFITGVCDGFSAVYDAQGNYLGCTGGFFGQGDGRIPDFYAERSNGLRIWPEEE